MTTYDKHCLELAQSFLSDSGAESMSADEQTALADALAKEIQQTIEDFLQDNDI